MKDFLEPEIRIISFELEDIIMNEASNPDIVDPDTDLPID